mmetsp:Transcript_32899/g.50306  ORF Transcript_32899/g.50306 Transcript_32899/m.50306 type:complete len:90 (-) Transcript_32899:85-354(-)
MISVSEEEALAKKSQPADFFIVRNNSSSTHFTEESGADAMKHNSLYSFASGQIMGSINPQNKAQAKQLGGARWTCDQEQAVDESFSDDE